VLKSGGRWNGIVTKLLQSGGMWSIVVLNEYQRWKNVMLIGIYQHSIDIKSRIIVPVKFRDELGNKFILTKGLDNCLFIYSLAEWEKFEQRLKDLPLGSKDARTFVRYFFSSAVECEVDKQGRLTIPQNLREHAKIEKELVTIGVQSRVEIWSKREWENFNAAADLSDSGIAEKMAELGV
jgi:MraZ protein